jgi:hypothetical protein
MTALLSSTTNAPTRISRRASIGIDFGSHSCKLAIAEPISNGWKIDSVARFVFPEGDPLASGYLREMLGTWKQELQLPTNTFACTLPPGITEYKCVELPPHAASDRSRLIERVLREQCGADPGTLAVDHWITASPCLPDVLSLHITWTDPAFLQRLYAECQAVDLHCQVVDAQPFVLTRWAEQWNPSSTAGMLLVDLGASTSMFAWVQYEQPMYVRRVRNLALAPVMHPLAQAYLLQRDELEYLCREIRLPSCEQATPAALQWEGHVSGWLHNLHTEIVRTMAFLKQKYEASGDEPIVLCGGGASMNGLAGWLAVRLPHAVTVAQLPNHWNWQAPLPYDPTYAAAIGLATLGGNR